MVIYNNHEIAIMQQCLAVDVVHSSGVSYTFDDKGMEALHRHFTPLIVLVVVRNDSAGVLQFILFMLEGEYLDRRFDPTSRRVLPADSVQGLGVNLNSFSNVI